MGSCGTMNRGDQIAYNGFHIIRPHIKTEPPPWFDVRVFYIRITNDLIDDSAPESLKLNHIPLEPETLIEINGKRCSLVSSLLRRHRVDKKSEEVTYVSTDSVRFTASVRFEVFNKDNLVLSGVLEAAENRNWSLKCKSELVVGCTSFLKADKFAMPVIEVYTAGCVSGSPMILTQTLKHNSQKKAYFSSDLGLQGVDQYRSYKMEGDEEGEDVSLYWRREYTEEEDGELMTRFIAGVRVGVGIGFGVCLGVGLLLRTCQITKKTLRRRLL